MNLAREYSDHASILFTSFAFLIPVSSISGAIFTLIGKALFQEIRLDTKATGFLTASNTMGGMLGALLTSIFFVTKIGIERSFFVFAVFYVVISLLTIGQKDFPHLSRKVFFYLLPGMVTLFLVFTLPFGRMENTYLQISASRYIEISWI